MNDLNITLATYILDDSGSIYAIKATIDGQEMHIPLNLDNRHYDEIMRQVNEGTLTIADAE